MKRDRRNASYLRRNPGQARLWRACLELNAQRPPIEPTKLRLLEHAHRVDHLDGAPTDLRRAGTGYRMIDRLIAEGWIQNLSPVEGVYRLRANPLEAK